MPYPIKLAPYYRHGNDTPWGGQKLKALFGKPIEDKRTGEALEASALDGMSSIILNGEFAQRPLSEAFEAWGIELTGVDGPFPLMVKLIDARESLSVQVHPTDEYAIKNEGKLGKSECWVVLDAEPGASIVCGMKKPDGRIATGSENIESLLCRMPVERGDVIYIPSGLVHALGEGIVVYELQQSSDVTYRLWDWGSGRQLHIRKAMDVVNYGYAPKKELGERIESAWGAQTIYLENEFFGLSKVEPRGEMAYDAGRMRIITALGDIAIKTPEGSITLSNGETAVIPAILGFAISGEMALMGSTPLNGGVK